MKWDWRKENTEKKFVVSWWISIRNMMWDLRFSNPVERKKDSLVAFDGRRSIGCCSLCCICLNNHGENVRNCLKLLPSRCGIDVRFGIRILIKKDFHEWKPIRIDRNRDFSVWWVECCFQEGFGSRSMDLEWKASKKRSCQTECIAKRSANDVAAIWKGEILHHFPFLAEFIKSERKCVAIWMIWKWDAISFLIYQ